MGLALFFLAVSHEVEGGRRRSVPSKEDLELEREVRRLNKPAVKSIKAWDLLSLHHNLSVSISKLIKDFFFFLSALLAMFWELVRFIFIGGVEELTRVCGFNYFSHSFCRQQTMTFSIA